MDYLENACNAVFDSKQFQDTLKNGKFDLVVVDIMLNYCMLGVIPHFKAPSIYLTTMAATTNTVEPLGTRLPPSFVPSTFLDLTDRMNFFERLLNFSFNIFMEIMGRMFFLPRFEKIFQSKLGIDTKINEIDKNVSLVLVNSHFTLTYPRPYLPDVVEVGGMHAKPAKTLPKVFEKIFTFKNKSLFLSGS
jgi:glucuronosyltransferase